MLSKTNKQPQKQNKLHSYLRKITKEEFNSKFSAEKLFSTIFLYLSVAQ